MCEIIIFEIPLLNKRYVYDGDKKLMILYNIGNFYISIWTFKRRIPTIKFFYLRSKEK
jgi:hypothetical protein